MKKSRTTAQSRSPRKVTMAHLPQALQELAINKPYYTARVVGNRIELTLYGGDVVYWPPTKE